MSFSQWIILHTAGQTRYNYFIPPTGFTVLQEKSIKPFTDIQIDGMPGAGRPRLTWKKLTERDCREWKLMTVDPQERSTWRSGVRSAMCVASQLPGKGPTDVDNALAPVC